MSSINKQALREVAQEATGAHDRLSVMPADDIFDISQHDGTQLDADITALNAFNEAANPATVLALLDELEAAEKRIAELEAREVREEGNQFLIVRHPGKAPVIKHCAGDMEQFLQQLIAQDSLATIDIVTHRYYGVGGQWVQDADEYLQIAGIITKVGE